MYGHPPIRRAWGTQPYEQCNHPQRDLDQPPGCPISPVVEGTALKAIRAVVGARLRVGTDSVCWMSDWRSADADHRLVEGFATHRTVEGGVPEGEDPTVGSHEVVATVVRSDLHPDDRLVEGGPAQGPLEGGVTKGEEAAVGGHEGVTATAW